jgi:hypothetical protein
MAVSSTIQLLNTIEWSKKMNFGRRSAIGNYLEPALTSANLVLQTIVGPPFAWRWNRVVTGFITAANQQDYTIFNYRASTAVQLGWFTIDDAGNCQVVTTAGSTGASVPSWNHSINGTTSDGTAVWTNKGPVNSTATGSYTFGWIETASVKDDKSNWIEMTPKLCLALESKTGRPLYIAAQTDDGNGDVTFRLNAAPDAAYAVAITIQQKPPIFTSTSQTWAPVPDEFSRIYSWGFLSLMWLFADDPRFGAANSKFVSQLLSASEGLTETERNIFLANWQMISGQPVENANKVSQGTQARGM